jgi:hypothetical protein
MYSGAPLYQFVLVPLSLFGTFSVCLAFVLLLPGVGNALAGIWTTVVGDYLNQRRLEQKARKNGSS